MVVFGDNANLSASAAKTIGALLLPAVKDRPEVADAPARARSSSSTTSRTGYAQLYDAEGRPVLLRLGRHQGPPLRLGGPARELDDGHMDYLVNEFRGPATFVVAAVRAARSTRSRTWASR